MVQAWALLLLEPTLVQASGLLQDQSSGNSVEMEGVIGVQAKREVKLNMK